MECEENEPRRERRSKVPGWVWLTGVGLLLAALSAHGRKLQAERLSGGATPAECLRALVLPVPDADRKTLLLAYQQAEKIPTSGAWDTATEAQAEQRLADFPASARAGLVAAMQRDEFFRRKS